MELIKQNWNKQDIPKFQKYLKSFSKGTEKAKWEKRIVNTTLPCIAVPSNVIKQISNQISKGNFLEFLDLEIWENLSNTFVNANLICKIKDFNLFKKYLKTYAKKCDNWASTDSLKFVINNKNKHDFFHLAKDYVKSEKTFLKRIGLLILLKLLKFDDFVDETLMISNSFKNETEYYVNMINAWLVCEAFIKHRNKTLEFFKNNNLNKFTQNKAISKCQDSFRISQEDKELLKTLRK